MKNEKKWRYRPICPSSLLLLRQTDLCLKVQKLNCQLAVPFWFVSRVSHSYTCHGSVMRVTRFFGIVTSFINTCNTTHAWVRKIHICSMTHECMGQQAHSTQSCVRRDSSVSVLCAIWLVHVCDSTHACVSHVCDLTHACVSQSSIMSATTLMHVRREWGMSETPMSAGQRKRVRDRDTERDIKRSRKRLRNINLEQEKRGEREREREANKC